MQLVWRSLTKAPQPAKSFIWSFFAVFLCTFVLASISGSVWAFAVGLAAAGVFLFLFGFCTFRDINGTATVGSRIYTESRGLTPEQFTFADVPTIKAAGFAHMLIGLFFVVIAVIALIEG
jgi:hypothetical protein